MNPPDPAPPPPEPDPAPSAGPGGGAGRGRGQGRGGAGGGRGGRGRGGQHGGRGQRNSGSRQSQGLRPSGGNSASMHGHVFQLPSESPDKKQFFLTLEMAKEVMAKEYKNAEDLMSLFADPMVDPVITNPARPVRPAVANMAADAAAVALEEHADSRARYNSLMVATDRRRERLTSNKSALWALLWGQCSDGLRAKVRAAENFSTEESNFNVFWLIQNIKRVMNKFDGGKHVFTALIKARKAVYNCKQGSMTDEDYLRTFTTVKDVLESYQGELGEHYSHAPEFDDDGDPIGIDERTIIARNRTLAALFIANADPRRYGSLTTMLANDFAMGVDKYPADLNAAYALLCNFESPAQRTQHQQQDPSLQEMTFVQAPNPTPGRNGIVYARITCHKCGLVGHYADQCPSEVSLAQFSFFTGNVESSATRSSKIVTLPDHWILLDTQSSISVFRNAAMLSNIRPADSPLTVYTNGGAQRSTHCGDITNLGTVWYNPRSIANILSLAQVRRVCRVTLDTAVEPALVVHKTTGGTMIFREMSSRLYVHDTTSPNFSTSPSVNAYTLLSSVKENMKNFTRRQIEGADNARALYRKLGRPSEQFFESILRRNLIRDCPVTVDDAKRAVLIYGPDIATLKGKTTRSSAASHRPSFQAVPIPAPILDHHIHVTLCIDHFFVQGLPFFHSISRGICFRTVKHVPNRRKATMLESLRSVMQRYQARGFRVTEVRADLEFACLEEDILPAVLHTVAADSHVPEVERSIRTIKERQRATVHGLPYKRVPTVLCRALIQFTVRCLNMFPAPNGVSDTLSPLTIMTGYPTPSYDNLKIEIGAYAQVFEENNPTNTQKARTMGAIALNHLGHDSADMQFMSLLTGEVITRTSWEEMPITDLAIARVERLAADEGCPLIQESGLLIEYRPDQPVEDDEYDADYVFRADADDVFNLDDYVVEDEDNTSDEDESSEDSSDDDDDELNDAPPQADDDNENDEEDNEGEDVPGVDDHDDASTDDDDDDDDEDDYNPPSSSDEEVNEDDNDIEEEVPLPPRREGLRRARTRGYSHRFAYEMDNPESRQSYSSTQFAQVTDTSATALNDESIEKHIFAYTMTQMSAKAGIKKHGREAEKALMKELVQLKNKDVFRPRHASSLTREQKAAALREISVIKEKRSGDLKGRTCADGRPQRRLYDKSKTSSPTISNDALFLTIMIDAFEGRDVATADVAGAYLNAKMRDEVIMRFTGKMVDLMCEVNPDFKTYVVVEGKARALYLQLEKALYGCVQSALLWYELFAETLQGMGFTLNPYDPCVANATINGKQCTVAWFVDDNKISHEDPNVVSSIIEKIEEKFGKMTIVRGKQHVFLGMNITYNDNRTATIQMKEYLEEAITDSGLCIKKTAASPAQKNIAVIDESSPRLSKEETEVFHSIVAKLLYVGIRVRKDIMMAVGFLCTRVSCPTKQDQLKLKRLLEYIHGSLDLDLTIGADDLQQMQTWIDASYAIHTDMKSHTGGSISFGTGAILSKSTKQKLNTKSSTEAELVGISEFLPTSIWTRMFMEAQGYPLSTNTLHQDNESTIKLAKNGRASAGKQSRHIDIRYFFVKDRIASENIDLVHCPTDQMLADFFTKPLQGSLFRKFRNVILGKTHVSTLSDNTSPHPSATEERVGKQEQIASTSVPPSWAEIVKHGGQNKIDNPSRECAHNLRTLPRV